LVVSKVAQVPVTLVDCSETAIDKGRSFMGTSKLEIQSGLRHFGNVTVCSPGSLLARDIEKQRITEEGAKQVKERITTTTELGDLCESDFVIEAVPVRTKAV